MAREGQGDIMNTEQNAEEREQVLRHRDRQVKDNRGKTKLWFHDSLEIVEKEKKCFGLRDGHTFFN